MLGSSDLCTTGHPDICWYASPFITDNFCERDNFAPISALEHACTPTHTHTQCMHTHQTYQMNLKLYNFQRSETNTPAHIYILNLCTIHSAYIWILFLQGLAHHCNPTPSTETNCEGKTPVITLQHMRLECSESAQEQRILLYKSKQSFCQDTTAYQKTAYITNAIFWAKLLVLHTNRKLLSPIPFMYSATMMAVWALTTSFKFHCTFLNGSLVSMNHISTGLCIPPGKGKRRFTQYREK